MLEIIITAELRSLLSMNAVNNNTFCRYYIKMSPLRMSLSKYHHNHPILNSNRRTIHNPIMLDPSPNPKPNLNPNLYPNPN